MRKYLVYLLLPLALAGCSGPDGSVMDDAPEGGHAAYRITGSINSIRATSRVVDGEVETKFQENDVMLIGWNVAGSGTYNGFTYKYGGDEKFTPGDGVDASALWDALGNEDGTVDVYAWYRKSDAQTVIPVGSTLSVTADQSTEAQYTANIYLAAHTTCDNTTTSLAFGFSHLTARLRLSIDFNDKGISTSEVQGAEVRIRLYTSGTLQPGKGTDKKLELVSPTTLEEVTMLTQGDNNYHIDCTCLLPPQTLTPANSTVTITLGSGKEYTCTLSKDLTLKAGEEAKVPIKISVEGTSVYDPVVTVIPETNLSSYSGNRLFTANSDNTLSVYDKQADGSWGAPAKVYEGVNSNTLLTISSEMRTLDLYKDYAAFSTGNGTTQGQLYFCKRDKATGKWYKANGPINRVSYTVLVNEHFLVAGGANESNSVTIYPIDADGKLNESGTYYSSLSGFKLSLAENDVLCTASASYQLYLSGTKVGMTTLLSFYADRIASDGYKVIMQRNGKIIEIRNINTGAKENIQDTPYAGVGVPVAIYDKYALVGGSGDDTANSFTRPSTKVDWVLLLYYDGTKWIHIGSKDDPDSFLKLLRAYAPNDEMTGADFHLEGSSIIMKGTRAVIQSHGKSYFIENIDELAAKWLKDNP